MPHDMTQRHAFLFLLYCFLGCIERYFYFFFHYLFLLSISFFFFDVDHWSDTNKWLHIFFKKKKLLRLWQLVHHLPHKIKSKFTFRSGHDVMFSALSHRLLRKLFGYWLLISVIPQISANVKFPILKYWNCCI